MDKFISKNVNSIKGLIYLLIKNSELLQLI